MAATSTTTLGEQGTMIMARTKKKRQLAPIDKTLVTAAHHASAIEETDRHRWAMHWGKFLAHCCTPAAQQVASMDDPISALAT